MSPVPDVEALLAATAVYVPTTARVQASGQMPLSEIFVSLTEVSPGIVSSWAWEVSKKEWVPWSTAGNCGDVPCSLQQGNEVPEEVCTVLRGLPTLGGQTMRMSDEWSEQGCSRLGS